MNKEQEDFLRRAIPDDVVDKHFGRKAGQVPMEVDGAETAKAEQEQRENWLAKSSGLFKSGKFPGDPLAAADRYNATSHNMRPVESTYRRPGDARTAAQAKHSAALGQGLRGLFDHMDGRGSNAPTTTPTPAEQDNTDG